MATKTWPRPGSTGIPKPSASDVAVGPMPTTRGANRELPNGMATFAKEQRPPPSIGQMTINPGRAAGRK
jgi:hypothetical protein